MTVALGNGGRARAVKADVVLLPDRFAPIEPLDVVRHVVFEKLGHQQRFGKFQGAHGGHGIERGHKHHDDGKGHRQASRDARV